MSNNPYELRKSKTRTFYVISVYPEKNNDNLVKYINKDYYNKTGWDYTVCIEKAMRFFSKNTITEFLDNNPDLRVHKIHEVSNVICAVKEIDIDGEF